MSDTLLKIEIVTPKQTAYKGNGQAITLPGTLGPFQVLVNHAPIISSLEIGAIKIIDEEGEDIYFATNGGFAEIKNNVVSIVVETAEPAAEIDIAKAQTTLAQAEERVALTSDKLLKGEEKIIIAQAKNRIRVVEASNES